MSTALSRYQVVIFDWDGTLMDSAGHIVKAVQAAAADCQLPVPEAAVVRQGIGSSFDAQYQRLFVLGTDLDDIARHDTVYQAFRQAFYRHYDGDTPPLYPAVILLLQQLQQQGKVLAIATSGSRSMLSAMLTHYHLHDLFSHTYCGDEITAKPAPDMLEAIVRDSGVGNSEVVMIGDSVYDIYAANNAGIASIGIATGVSSHEALQEAGAILVLDTIDPLVN